MMDKEDRIYSNKHRGAYLIFRVSGAALIRGRRLFKRLIPQRQNILIGQFNLLHEYFSWLTGLKLTS